MLTVKSIKFFCWAFIKLFTWIAAPVWKCFYRLTWKGTPQELISALMDDPDVIRMASETGSLHLLQAYKDQLMRFANAPKPITKEDREWGMFIQNYGENPQPDMVPEYLRYIRRGGTTGSTELPTWGALEALCARHRDYRDQWVSEFADIFDELERKSERAETERPGWNDYYMTKWFILREDRYAQIIAERTKSMPGMAGYTCTWMANSVAQQIPAFKEALERIGYDFPNLAPGRAVETPPASPAIDAGFLRNRGEQFHAAIRDEREIYPLSIDACNEFLQTLAGAAVIETEVSQKGGMEYFEIVTTAGMLAIVAPDLGISYKKQPSNIGESRC